MKLVLAALVTVMVSALGSAQRAASPPGPGGARWDDSFGTPGPDSRVTDSVVFDDGSGEALYIAGYFHSVDGLLTHGVARWNGSSWESIGSVNQTGYVLALGVHIEAGEPRLYIGGTFSLIGGVNARNLAYWNGEGWFSAGVVTAGPALIPSVRSFLSDGGALYIGGFFTRVGGVSADNVARWDGTSWSALGAGVPSSVQALIHSDVDGTQSLYAGTVGDDLQRWDGTAWSAVAGAPSLGSIEALVEFDGGSGKQLVLGANVGISRWDGSVFTPLGPPTIIGGFESLIVDRSGPSELLYAGGRFDFIGPTRVNRIARFDGSSWTPVGLPTPGIEGIGNLSSVSTMTFADLDDDGTSFLYAGGEFFRAGDSAASNFAVWNRFHWDRVGSALGVSGTSGLDVAAFEVHDDGTGAALYVGGGFDTVGDIVVGKSVVRWDGSGWSKVPGDFDSRARVYALASFDDGSGPGLFIGGSLEAIDAQPVAGIARWSGTSWSDLGGGVFDGNRNGQVGAMEVWDDGNGAALYVFGNFDRAGTTPAQNIARWDGSEWNALGEGLDSGGLLFNFDQYSLEVYDDGSGEALYAAGRFDNSGPITLNGLARWDGSTWTDIGAGLTGVNPTVSALRAADLPELGGSVLVVGGQFTHADGTAVEGVATWNGTSFAPIGVGFDGGAGHVSALEVFDSGYDRKLFAAGSFTGSGANALSTIAVWSGGEWRSPDEGLYDISSSVIRTVRTLKATRLIPDEPELWAGGEFSGAGGSASRRLARWFRKDRNVIFGSAQSAQARPSIPTILALRGAYQSDRDSLLLSVESEVAPEAGWLFTTDASFPPLPLRFADTGKARFVAELSLELPIELNSAAVEVHAAILNGSRWFVSEGLSVRFEPRMR